ncbi:MAG: hypothetical protein U0Y10_09860 [Spirosomataceae bacterium]
MKKIILLLLISLISHAGFSQNPFKTRWNLALSTGSGATQISFYVRVSGTVNYTWQEIGGGGATGSGTIVNGSGPLLQACPPMAR